MARNAVAAFLAEVDPTYSQYEAALRDKGYTSVAELGAAEVQDLERAQVPLPAARLIIRSASRATAGHAWRQVDATRLVTQRKHLYATAILINDNVDPPKQCTMRLMVDSGSGMELVIPKHKAEQLQLVQRDITTAEGYGGAISEMIVYKPLLVKLPATSSLGVEEVFKQADLTVFARNTPANAEERTQGEEDLSQFAGFRQATSVDGALQLSPISSPPKGELPAAILGIQGLHKLRVLVDAEHSCLLPVITPDIVY